MEMPLTITSGQKILMMWDVLVANGTSQSFNIFVLKEPDYNIMIMSTFLGFTVTEGQKEERRMVNGEVVKFKYPEVVADDYIYRGAVENHNVLRYSGGIKPQFGLDSKLGTTWWHVRVFAFFIACTEVNACLAMKYFLKTDDKCMDFKNNWLRG